MFHGPIRPGAMNPGPDPPLRRPILLGLLTTTVGRGPETPLQAPAGRLHRPAVHGPLLPRVVLPAPIVPSPLRVEAPAVRAGVPLARAEVEARPVPAGVPLNLLILPEVLEALVEDKVTLLYKPSIQL